MKSKKQQIIDAVGVTIEEMYHHFSPASAFKCQICPLDEQVTDLFHLLQSQEQVERWKFHNLQSSLDAASKEVEKVQALTNRVANLAELCDAQKKEIRGHEQVQETLRKEIQARDSEILQIRSKLSNAAAAMNTVRFALEQSAEDAQYAAGFDEVQEANHVSCDECRYDD